MTPLIRKFLGMNWLLFAVMTALAVFGVLAIYNATWFRDLLYWRHQSQFLVVGLVVFLVTSLIDYRWVRWGAAPTYLLSIGLLIATLIFGREVSGAKSWLQIGPYFFQAAQLALMAGIMVLALLLSQFRNLHPFVRLILAGAVAGAPLLLILKQPDFGTAMMWIPVFLAMLFIGGMQMRYLISLLLMGAGALPILLFFGLKPHQRGRITAFLDPEINPESTGWALNQSLIAIGSGGWGGRGFKATDTQVEMGFVPTTTVHTDYIFTSIGETWGFLGGVVLLSAFGLLLIVCLHVAYKSPDDLGVLLSGGVASLIFIHVFQNVGMTIQLMPITGVPLPLISYGGSFLVVIMFGLGLVNSVWIHRKVVP